MIIKGNPAGNTGFWGKHLESADNERAEVVEMRGLLSDNLKDGLKEMAAIASQSRSEGNFLYQANINPDQPLTPDQWREAIDTLEKNLGLEGHQRIVVEHEKADESGELRTHRHIIWNRVDVETLRVADMGGNWLTHMKTARELENSFDHTPTPRPPIGERVPAHELWEIREADRTQIHPEGVKKELTELWRATETGQEFKEAVEDRGYILAKGDRRDFCIVDEAGTAHSLARRLEDVKAKDVRERMADVDRDSLPTVAEARAEQRERETETRVVQVTAKDAEPSYSEQKFKRDQESYQEWREDHMERFNNVPGPRDATPLKVAGAVFGASEMLTDFVSDLLFGGGGGGSGSNNKDHREALEAIERIHEHIERQELISPDDVKLLTPTHLENIYARGDDYVREIIDDARRARERQEEFERARER